MSEEHVYFGKDPETGLYHEVRVTEPNINGDVTFTIIQKTKWATKTIQFSVPSFVAGDLSVAIGDALDDYL